MAESSLDGPVGFVSYRAGLYSGVARYWGSGLLYCLSTEAAGSGGIDPPPDNPHIADVVLRARRR
jgi:hypothetical protein